MSHLKWYNLEHSPALLNQFDAPTASVAARASTKYEPKCSFILIRGRSSVVPSQVNFLLSKSQLSDQMLASQFRILTTRKACLFEVRRIILYVVEVWC